jgi:hypothetical protein
MDISSSRQINLDELISSRYDVMIFSYCAHERWNWLLSKVQAHVDRKILLLFDDADTLFSGDNYFESLDVFGIETRRYRSDDTSGIEELMSELIRKANGEEFRILIDYSSMSRPWYSAVIKSFLKSDLYAEGKLLVYFVTTPPTYFDPPAVIEVGDQGPMLEHSVIPGKKKLALILGLGYEARPALKLVSRLKPDQLFLFYADPHFHPQFLENEMDLNKKLIQQAGEEHLHPYPVQDIEKTDHILTSLILKLRQTHHIIIVPLGPKVFALNSLLIQSRFPDIEVWDAGFEAWVAARQIGTSGSPLIYEIEFSEE